MGFLNLKLSELYMSLDLSLDPSVEWWCCSGKGQSSQMVTLGRTALNCEEGADCTLLRGWAPTRVLAQTPCMVCLVFALLALCLSLSLVGKCSVSTLGIRSPAGERGT